MKGAHYTSHNPLNEFNLVDEVGRNLVHVMEIHYGISSYS